MSISPDWYAQSRERSKRYWQERLGREPTFTEVCDAFVEETAVVGGRFSRFIAAMEARPQ